MFNDERHNKILEIIESAGRVEVSGLSDLLKVSVDTIRRDLKKLEEEGLLKRTHGGAVRVKPVGDAYDYATRKRIHSKEKRTIAMAALAFIEDHDSILVDGSTTVSALVPLLTQKKSLKVFTNSIQIAADLQKLKSDMKVFIIGGLLDTDHGSAVSHDAVSFIEKLHVNKVFIGSCSISIDRGLSTSEVEDASIKRAMLKAGEKICILADHSKFTRESLIKIADLSDKWTIITDEEIYINHEDLVKALEDSGAEVIMAR